jgi:AcrR family transcriptional regulator
MAVTKQKSASVSHRRDSASQDERIRRTRAQIDSAFVQLLHRRPYGDIRISQLCKKAGVGRATFYAHYATKDALLLSQFQRIVSPMLAAIPGEPPRVDATALFAHICSDPGIYRALMGANGGSAPRVLMQCFEMRLRELVSPSVDGRATLAGLALPRVLASSLLAIIECSLERAGVAAPPQMQRLFYEISSPVLARIGTDQGSKYVERTRI